MDARERAYLGYQQYERHQSDERLHAMEKELGIIDLQEARLAVLMEQHAAVTAVSSDKETVVREVNLQLEDSEDPVTIASATHEKSGSFSYSVLRGDDVLLSSDHLQGYASSFQEARATGLTTVEQSALQAMQHGTNGLQFFVQELSLVGAPQENRVQQFDLAA